MVRDVGFAALVHVLGAVEARRAAGTDAIGAEGFDGFFFEGFVGGQVVVVVGGEVGHGTAVGELGFGAGRPGEALERCLDGVCLWRCRRTRLSPVSFHSRLLRKV